MTKTKTNEIDESLPKSTRERIFRKLRPKIKSPKKARKEPQMKGRIVPKKDGDNDPRRNNPWVEEVIGCLNSIDEGEPIEGLETGHIEILLEFVTHMIAVSMGGWEEEEDGYFINESGRIARSKNWTLHSDGTLSNQNGEQPEFDTEWLHSVRDKLCVLNDG